MPIVNFYLRDGRKERSSILLYLTHKGYQKGKTLKFGTGEVVAVVDWDKAKQRIKRSKDNPFSAMANQTLHNMREEAIKVFREYLNDGRHMTQQKFTTEMNRRMGFTRNEMNFYDMIKITRSTLSIGSQIKSDSLITKLKQATKRKTLSVYDIDTRFLNKYIRYCKEKGNAPNTINKDIGTLQSVFNEGRKRYPELRSIEDPFPYITAKRVKTNKPGLDLDQIQKLKGLDLSGLEEVARDAWIFSFFCAGIRIRNLLLLKKSNVQNGVLNYIMDKTRNTEIKNRSISMSAPALAILFKYGFADKEHGDYLFPLLNPAITDEKKLYSHINSRNVAINNALRRISKKHGLSKFSTHIARNSFAQILSNDEFREELRLSLKDISKMLGHATISQTEAYLAKYDQSNADKNIPIVNRALSAIFKQKDLEDQSSIPRGDK